MNVLRCFLAALVSSAIAAQLDLATVRGIEHFPGDADARAKLARLGFVTLPATDTGMHRIYERSQLPPLLTVDVALHALVVQQRALLRQIDQQLAAVLASFCARGFALASARAGQAHAYADAARFFGTARRAQGDGWQPAHNGALLADEASRAEPWVCVDARALETSSTHRDDRALEQYFAARRWLGARRFAMERPDHAACAQAIATLVRDDPELRAAHAQLTAPFAAWLGPSDPDVVTAQPLPARGAVGLLPARELPCDRTLRQVAGAGLPPWPFAILASGTLRSAAGRELVAARFGNAVATAIHDQPAAPHPPSLYIEFLRAVASVHDVLPADAPALFHSAAWQRRLCETQLGAWLTMREAVAAHAIRMLGSRNDPPAGYIAPYPQTFLAVAELAGKLEALAAAWDRARRFTDRAAPSRDDLLQRATAAREVFATMRALDHREAEAFAKTLLDRHARGDSLTAEQAEIVRAMGSDLILSRCALTAIARHGQHFAQIAAKQLRRELLEPRDLTLLGKLPSAIAAMTVVVSGEDGPIVLPCDETTWLGTTKHDALYAILDCGGTPTLLLGAVCGVAEDARPADRPWRAQSWREAAARDELPRPAEFAGYRGSGAPR